MRKGRKILYNDIKTKIHGFTYNVSFWGKTKTGRIIANPLYTDYLTNPSEKTFFLRPTIPDETEDIIKKLSVGKSLGRHSIPTKLLKQFSKSISIPLSVDLN